ncbi:MAG: TPM domain-containing protein [Chitinophagaceae bacterium]
MILSFFERSKPIFEKQDIDRLKLAIAAAEKSTSGEIRVFIESRCRYVEATDRAAELFVQLKMQETAARNGVLIYLATKDHQLAIWGDQGIHENLGDNYWQQRIHEMISTFNTSDYVAGIIACIEQIGVALSTHFPYQGDADKNELSDEIIFGS